MYLHLHMLVNIILTPEFHKGLNIRHIFEIKLLRLCTAHTKKFETFNFNVIFLFDLTLEIN